MKEKFLFLVNSIARLIKTFGVGIFRGIGVIQEMAGMEESIGENSVHSNNAEALEETLEFSLNIVIPVIGVIAIACGLDG